MPLYLFFTLMLLNPSSRKYVIFNALFSSGRIKKGKEMGKLGCMDQTSKGIGTKGSKNS
jgi:hypothetical protein